MAAVSTSIKIDPVLKVRAQDVLGRMGLTLNGGINLFLHQVVNENGIPFRPHVGVSVSPSGDPYFDDPVNVARIKAEMEARRLGKAGITKSLEELEAME